ncbi:MAG: type II toxin-antitoxin system RelE/ParE family toxin [Thermodesulfobacteriota bacterium]|nr:type II toxin-antitoxin system RelE/ParE family toxin [Thermodesulfobacteriota bacterium]
MSYKIVFKRSVAWDIKKIDKDLADRILKKIEDELPEKAESFPVLTVKFSGLRKFQAGDYRVVYFIIEDTALILRIRHRLDAYR